jgi:hypothetical protein
MRSRHVIRYLCDFCNKGMFKRPSMEKHESVCFQNPQRKCWGCEFHGDIETAPMPELIAALEKDGLPSLRVAAHNCPACIMAALIQQGKSDPAGEKLPADVQPFAFNYKSEMEAFRSDVMNSRPEDF